MANFYSHPDFMPPKQKKPIVPPLSMIYRKIAVSFVVLTVLLLGIIVFFSLAKATVAVTPKKELKSAEFLVTVKETPVDGSGQIAGRYEETVVEEEGQFEATGATEKPGKSGGTVTLTNITTAPQPLVATTRLLSEGGVLFRMKKAASVPAHGSVDVEVYADAAGSASDIAPAKFTIPGLNAAKQKLIYGESKSAMVGGAQTFRSVTGDDLEKAKIEVVEKATKKVQADFDKSPEAALGGVVIQSDAVSVTPDAKIGEERQTFSVKAQVKAQIVSYDKAALEKIARVKVGENIPADRDLIAFHSDAMVVRFKQVTKETGEVQIQVYADAEVRINSGSPILDPVKIAGMLPEEAAQYLKSFDAVQDVEVTLFPSWQKRIPTMPDRIKIVIKK